MRKLYIVRHGEIDYNKEGRYAGSVDVDLNEVGIQQTSSVQGEVEKLQIDLIISSPLKRCTKMVDIINKKLQKPVIIMPEFRERSVGVFEGLTREEAKNKYPDLWSRNVTRIYDDAPTNGETIRQVEERVFAGLEKIISMTDHNNILIITHAFVGKMIHKYFHPMSELEFFEYKLENAKIIEYKI